jgi:hypothetical protein
MKTALIVSGQIRDGKKCFDSINEHILKKYNPDVFAHTWIPNEKMLDHRGQRIEDDASIVDVMNMYKPKSFLVEDFESPNNIAAYNALANISDDAPHRMAYDGSHAWESKFENVYFMYYSIFKAWMLKQHYEQTNKVKYDYLIRIRFDVSYDEFPMFVSKANTLQIPLGHSARGGISDLLVCGEDLVMDRYCQLFTKIFDYFKNGETLHPESMFKRYLEQQKINVERFPLSYYLRGNRIEQYE